MWAAGLGHSVGEGEEGVARVQLGVPEGVDAVGVDPDGRPGGLQRARRAPVGVQHQGRVVAAVDVDEAAGERVEHPEEEGGEVALPQVVAGEVAVGGGDRVEQRGGADHRDAAAASGASGDQVLESAVLRGVPQQGADERHEECGADSLVADVGDDEGEPAAAGYLEDVVEVPGDLAGRPEPDVDLPAVRDGQPFGQEARLDLPADLQLLLVAHEFGAGIGFAQGAAESGALRAAVQAGPDQGGQEGRDEVVVPDPYVFLQCGELRHGPDDHDGCPGRAAQSAYDRPHGLPVGLGRGEQHVRDGQLFQRAFAELREGAGDEFRVHGPQRAQQFGRRWRVLVEDDHGRGGHGSVPSAFTVSVLMLRPSVRR